VIEHRIERRRLGARAGMPLGHVARFGAVEPEAEAETGLSVLRQRARDERFLARREAHGMDMDEG
jgi:hypothetical protein